MIQRVVTIVFFCTVSALTLPATAQSVCPDTATPLGPSQWWETSPPYELISSVQMDLTFTNTSGFAIDFSTIPEDTLQLWSIPTVLDPPIVYTTVPTGTVPAGGSYSYSVIVDVTPLPPSENAFGIRPVSINLGTMGPEQATLTSAVFDCVPAQPQDRPIPVSPAANVALLLILAVAGFLALKRS